MRSSGIAAEKARPVAVPSTDITVPARIDTSSGWRASIMRTMVGPMLPHSANATAKPVWLAKSCATGSATRIGSSCARLARPTCSAAGPSA